MPPKKDNKDPNESGETKKKRKYKTRKKKECPSRIRKTDRVVIHKQARDMIAKVYEFMKREAVKEYAEKLTNARWRTATAVGVSEKTVSRILKERAKKAAAAVNAAENVLDGKSGTAGSIFSTELATDSNMDATGQTAGLVIGAKINGAQALGIGGAAITAVTENIPRTVEQNHDTFDNLSHAELNAAGILANAAIGNGRYYIH